MSKSLAARLTRLETYGAQRTSASTPPPQHRAAAICHLLNRARRRVGLELLDEPPIPAAAQRLIDAVKDTLDEMKREGPG